MHPDVHAGQSSFEHLRKKLTMSIRALVLPETTVTLAREEWWEARALHRALVYEAWRKELKNTKNAHLPWSTRVRAGLAVDPSDRSTILKTVRLWFDELGASMGFGVDDCAFTKQVAFFVVMGGFVNKENITVTAKDFYYAFKEGKIDDLDRIARRNVNPAEVKSTKANDLSVATDTDRITTPSALTAQATNKEVEAGHVNSTQQLSSNEIEAMTSGSVLPISTRDIQDKGKASVIAKVIIAGQVNWLVLQLIARIINGLPIALIELHVLIHILVAAMVYGFWWNKPMDVYEPIILDIPCSGTQGNSKSRIAIWSNRPDNLRSKEPFRRFFENIWLLPLLAPVLDTCADSQDDSVKEAEPSNESEAESTMDTMSRCVFYFGYGALHAFAWNSYFTTSTEKWIWRGACMVVGLAPAVVVGVVRLFDVIRMLLPHEGAAISVAETTMGNLLQTVYLVGAGSLLLEGFVNLRRLPTDAYLTIPWTAYIPHF